MPHTLVMETAKQLERASHKLRALPRIGPVFAHTLKGLAHARGLAAYAAWRSLGTRPEINLASIRSVLGPPSGIPPMRLSGRLIAHVAFHFNPGRITYLSEVLRALSELPFETIHIVLDTNTERTERYLGEKERDCLRHIAVHRNLSHPYRLTWAHREAMRRAVPHYDYFMYVEDDILITREAVLTWAGLLPGLRKAGYLPGFLRLEKNRSGAWVASDIMPGHNPGAIVELAGRSYLHARHPYQAFWLYDRETMLEFVASDAYRHGPEGFGIREQAAFGFTFEATPRGLRSRHLVPLAATSAPDPGAYVFHMPSNYGKLLLPHPAGLGTVPLDRLCLTPAP